MTNSAWPRRVGHSKYARIGPAILFYRELRLFRSPREFSFNTIGPLKTDVQSWLNLPEALSLNKGTACEDRQAEWAALLNERFSCVLRGELDLIPRIFNSKYTPDFLNILRFTALVSVARSSAGA